MDITVPAKLGGLLSAAGFVNICCHVKKVPIGVWTGDKTLRLIGLYQKMVVDDIMPTFAARPFRSIGIAPREARPSWPPPAPP